jgi:hypothetical protein
LIDVDTLSAIFFMSQPFSKLCERSEKLLAPSVIQPAVVSLLKRSSRIAKKLTTQQQSTELSAKLAPVKDHSQNQCLKRAAPKDLEPQLPKKSQLGDKQAVRFNAESPVKAKKLLLQPQPQPAERQSLKHPAPADLDSVLPKKSRVGSKKAASPRKPSSPEKPLSTRRASLPTHNLRKCGSKSAALIQPKPCGVVGRRSHATESWADPESPDWDVLRFLADDRFLAYDPHIILPVQCRDEMKLFHHYENFYLGSGQKIHERFRPKASAELKPMHPVLAAHIRTGTATRALRAKYSGWKEHDPYSQEVADAIYAAAETREAIE